MRVLHFPNPFRTSIVSDPWQLPDTDVPAIHAAAFDRLCLAVRYVKSEGRTTSLLLHGAAGSGKTHVLARLRSHLASTAAPFLFIAVRLQTGPRMIWRHLRSRFADDLLRPSDGSTSQLERLILHRLSEIGGVGMDWDFWLKETRRMRREDAAEALFEFLDPGAQLGGNRRRVLIHLLMGTRRSDAGAWLRGESLPEAVLERLELNTAEPEEEEQEEQAHQTVLALCSLAGPRIPVIFCFDQVEALQIHPHDETGLFAFGQMVSSLHDQTHNSLLISCIQSAFVDMLNQAVREADRDRLLEFAEVAINPLTWPEAVQLIAARMDSSPSFRERRSRQSDPLWPLKEAEIRSIWGQAGSTARKLLSHCADLIERFNFGGAEPHQAPGLGPVRLSLDKFLEEVWQGRLEEASAANSPEQTDQIVAHGLPLLVDLAGGQWKNRVEGSTADVDLEFDSRRGRVGVSLCNRNMKSLWRRLERLRKTPPEVGKLVLIRDARLPISAGAVRTRQLREELLQQGCSWVNPSQEAMAALDALRSLLGDAKAGDLANSGETVEPQSVQQWLAANLPQSLKDLLEDVLTDRPTTEAGGSDASLADDITELLQQRHILSAADIASMLHHSVGKVETAAQQHPDRFGVLTGPPAVLFELSSGSIAS